MINATIDGDANKAQYYEQLYVNTIMDTKGKTEKEARDMLEQKVIKALIINGTSTVVLMLPLLSDIISPLPFVRSVKYEVKLRAILLILLAGKPKQSPNKVAAEI